MTRPDGAPLRSAGFVVLFTGVFLMVNSQVVYAASSNSESGDLLAPLNITSSEGVAINGYELNAQGGSIVSFKTQSLAFVLSGLFTVSTRSPPAAGTKSTPGSGSSTPSASGSCSPKRSTPRTEAASCR